jgi:hypothetical protein
MAAELQQALLEVRMIPFSIFSCHHNTFDNNAWGQAGGNTSICDLCRPSIEGQVPLLGLQEKKLQDLPNSKIKLRNRLSDIIDAANQCWVCGWLLLLFRNRRSESFAEILPANYECVWLGIEPDYIYNFERGRTYNDVSKDQRVLIRISVYIDPRTISRKFDYFLYLQQSSEKTMKLPDLLDQTNSLE